MKVTENIRKVLTHHNILPFFWLALGVACLILAISIVPKAVSAALSTPDALKGIYSQSVISTTTPVKKIRILLVPGHDNQYWGTEFRDVKEADVTLGLAESLYSLLKKDPHFETFITRSSTAGDDLSYTEPFSSYFVQSKQAISDHMGTVRQAKSTQISTGAVQMVDGVPHNNANSDVAFRLFGINKWIDDNNIDLVLHVHVNDAPGRANDNPGPYRGFAIYIPERQYSNSFVSSQYGFALYNQLGKYYSQSILPKENVGLVEEQELIAIGPWNSLKAGVALVEYGYIYEPQFLNTNIRTGVVNDLAFQTYLGIHRFFGDNDLYTGKYGTPLLPYTWSKTVNYGTLYDQDILHLQAALRFAGFYPAIGKENLDCRMTGNFSPCVQAGLAAFQKKYKIAGGDGTTVGPKTRAQLNKLFSK